MIDIGFGTLILFFVIFLGVGRMCGWGVRRYRNRCCEPGSEDDDRQRRLVDLESRIRRLGDRDRARERLASPAMHTAGKGEAREPALLKRRRKSPLEELQQKFIEGRLSLADYERELDRLERIE